MGRIKNMLGINRQTALLSVAQGSPLTACYFLLQVQPVVSHGLKELEDTNPRHAMVETALISYLMGMGFSYRTALAIVESWESDHVLLEQGILSE